MTQAIEDEKLTLSTGITVGIRKISPFTMDAISRAFPAPQPPLVESEFAPGDVRTEPNEADPDYQAALRDHQIMLGGKIQEVMWRLGVAVDIDPGRLTALRETMNTLGISLDDSDQLAYVKHVVIGSQDDMMRLAAAITGKSEPTEEAVAAAVATFPGDVPGA